MSTTTFTPLTHQDYDRLKGFEVFTSDNEKLGTIAEVCHPAMDMPAARGNHYFRVEPGTLKKLFTDAEEVFVPEQLIRSVDLQDDTVVLDVPKARVQQTDWSRPGDFETYRRF
jgi:hypothetical protein